MFKTVSKKLIFLITASRPELEEEDYKELIENIR